MRSSKPAVGCRRETEFRRKTSDKSGKTLIEDKMRTQSNNMYYGMSTKKRRSRDASVNGGDTVEIHARAIYPDRRADCHLILKIRADLRAICRWSRFPGRLRTGQIGHNSGARADLSRVSPITARQQRGKATAGDGSKRCLRTLPTGT